MNNSIPSRATGILIPVFALRREGDLGIGDTAALRQMVDWASASGVGLLQLLPINESGPDCSPYNAISSVALDPVLLEMSAEAVPGLTDGAVERARDGLGCGVLGADLVDYPAVRRAKRTLLEEAYAAYLEGEGAEPGHPLEDFRKAEDSWLEDYCLFRVLMDREGGRETWDLWSEEYNTAEKARTWLRQRLDEEGTQGATARQMGLHAFIQWVAFSQWRALRRYAGERGVKLMGDIPIGVSYYSSDVFLEPEHFDLEWSGGAPPERIFKDDPFVQKWGQNWGIPLYKWEQMAESGFTWWNRRIDKLTDVFHVFRIDHVLGFYRIYSFPWRPQLNAEFLPLTEDEAAVRTGGRLPHFQKHADDTDEHKAANLAHGDRYLRLVIEAAGDAEVIGEDLGVVPDYVRPHLLELGVPGFKIVHWEVHPDGRVIHGSEYPECSFTTVCTHDHEPMAALWERFRAESRGERGDEDDHWKAKRDLRLLCDFADIPVEGEDWPPYDRSIKWRLIGALLRSQSRYAAFMITDLYGRHERFNIPGVVHETNWRTRLPWAVADMMSDPELRAESDALLALSVETGRHPG